MATPLKKVVDLDAELGIYDEAAPAHTKKVKLLGREWTVVCDVNNFSIAEMMSGDAGAVARFIVNVIHPDEADQFRQELGKVKNLSAEKLGLLLNRLIEVAGERPTESPSTSRRTAGSRTSVRK